MAPKFHSDVIQRARSRLSSTQYGGCGTDKVNAPLCKTVIDLAHGFGRYVVAVGIEKAADASQRAATQGRSLDTAPA
jgi:hypothetical protein